MTANKSLFEELKFSPDDEKAIDLESIQKAAWSLERVLDAVGKTIAPNTTTRVLANFIEVQLRNEGVDSDCIILISPEEVVWHGKPSNRILHSGEIVTVDVACSYHGWWADSSVTFPIGEIDSERTRLIIAALEGTRLILNHTRSGSNGREGALSLACLCEQYDVRLIPEAAGHGVGQFLHCDPVITYDGRPHEPLSQDSVYTVEPIFTNGDGKIQHVQDGSAVTIDGRPTAHFETTVHVHDKGLQILGCPSWISSILC